MNFKIIGAVFVIVACGGFGALIAASYRKEVKMLRELICVLDYMECELQYRQTPLPELCRQAAIQSSTLMKKMFITLAQELEDQISPDVQHCVAAAIAKNPNLPKTTRQHFEMLGQNLGRFDLEGQLKGLELVRHECRRNLDSLTANQESKLRSYQTLGLCAGAAIAILFV